MTDTELIARQAKRIVELEDLILELNDRFSEASTLIVGIGGPLNDDRLSFNSDQKMLFRQINSILEG